MNCAGGFAANGLNDARMRVTKRVHSDPAKKIQIFLAAGIENKCTATVGEKDRRTFVGRQEELVGIMESRGRTAVFKPSPLP